MSNTLTSTQGAVDLVMGNVMKEKVYLKENGAIKSKVVINKYGAELLTTRNGWQWTGQGISPELAKLTIKVLQKYLENN